MSVVVAVTDRRRGVVVLASDQLMSRGDTGHILGEQNAKVFRVATPTGEFACGFAGETRCHQIVEHVARWPDAPVDGLTVAWAVRGLVPALREALVAAGRDPASNFMGGGLFVALGSRLLWIHVDLAVTLPGDIVGPRGRLADGDVAAALGSGEDLAMGALYALTRGPRVPDDGQPGELSLAHVLATIAVEAAISSDKGCAGEVVTLETRPDGHGGG